ncbi:MAG: T9SS type A sorting domain-containing protein, partial [Sphingobacteriales bacterium]
WQYTPGFETSIIGAATGNSNLSTYKFRPNIQITYTSVLDVDVLRFSARTSGRNVVTQWDVANEKNMSGYEVERSTDGQRFETVGSVAAGTASGSGSYSFTDSGIASVSDVQTLFYRLKCKETSGSFKYSSTAQVSIKAANAIAIDAFPSPVDDVLIIRLTGKPGSNAVLNVSNGTGKLVRKLSMTSSEQKIDLTGCSGGLYFVTYTDDSYNETLKVTKR